MIDARQHIIGKYTPYDFETITIASIAIGLTAGKLASAPKPKRAFITIETATCRYREEDDPTSTVGHLLLPTQSIVIEGYSRLNGIKFIRTGVTSATLMVTYYR